MMITCRLDLTDYAPLLTGMFVSLTQPFVITWRALGFGKPHSTQDYLTMSFIEIKEKFVSYYPIIFRQARTSLERGLLVISACLTTLCSILLLGKYLFLIQTKFLYYIEAVTFFAI